MIRSPSSPLESGFATWWVDLRRTASKVRLVAHAMTTLAIVSIATLGLPAAPACAVQAQQHPATEGPRSGSPRLYAAFAAREHRSQVPAIAWLCDEYLPGLPSWPEELDPSQPFAINLSLAGMQVRATDVRIPVGAAAVGSCSLASGDAPTPMSWLCGTDGRERWFVPTDFALDPSWERLLHSFEADLTDVPRTVSVPILISHLAGAAVEGDPRSGLLRLLPTLCGDATWLAWRQHQHLHVCGQSGGGLMLPFVLLAIAVSDGSGQPSALALRAFAGRDPDQEEAARQLGRSDRKPDVSTLHSLLHAAEPVRRTAIDALVRQGVCEELPSIIEAADATLPWATLAAKHAIQRLWPHANDSVRSATRKALSSSENPTLRSMDLDSLPTLENVSDSGPRSNSPRLATAPAPPRGADEGLRARILLVLFCLSIGLLGLWSRERARLQMQPT